MGKKHVPKFLLGHPLNSPHADKDMTETLNLLRWPANAWHLSLSIAQYLNGKKKKY